jgi:hypothetical protein
MSHIEVYYNTYLDRFIDKNNPSLNNRENVRRYKAYAFQATLDAFIHLETELRKEFDEKFRKQQEEIDALKKALADTLAALAGK